MLSIHRAAARRSQLICRSSAEGTDWLGFHIAHNNTPFTNNYDMSLKQWDTASGACGTVESLWSHCGVTVESLWRHCGVTVDSACLKTLNVHNPSNTDQCSEPKVALSALGHLGYESLKSASRGKRIPKGLFGLPTSSFGGIITATQ